MPPGRWFASLPCWSSWTTPKLRTRKILQTSRVWSSNSRRSWWGNILSIFFQKNYDCFELWVQVDRVDFDGEGNLLQLAVKMNQKEYLQILLDYGSAVFPQNLMRISFQIFFSLDPMARQAFDGRSRVRQIHESRLSPLEEAIVRGHMEVWNLLKEQTEMISLILICR